MENSLIDLAELAHYDATVTFKKQVLHVVDAAALLRTISPALAIELVDAAMRRLSDGLIVAPERSTVPVAPGGKLGLMPGTDPELECFGVKVLSLFDRRANSDVSSHQGLMLLFDHDTGQPLAVIDASALTGLRTAAASAVATRALARKDSRVLALLGTGEQAHWHARMIPLVRPIDEIRVWSRTPGNAHTFAQMHGQGELRMIPCDNVADAVDGADVVCTLTHSREAILLGEWLQPGQHINLVGASTVDAREIDDAAVARSRFFVDSRSHALTQAGELLGAIRSGIVTTDHIVAEIGEVLLGRAVGRPDATTITAYKSLGHVAQDLAVAQAAVARLDRGGATAIAWERSGPDAQ